MNDGSGFDWVMARSQCSITQVFVQLQMGADKDVRKINELYNLRGDSAFQLTAQGGDQFTIHRHLDSDLRAAHFQVKANQIWATASEKQPIIATVTLNNEGRCRLKVSE